LERLCFLDGRPGEAIVATVGGAQVKVIAIACHYVGLGDPAILVEDNYRGRGLGKWLFLAVCRHAGQMGLKIFEGFGHPENHRVLRLIKSCGLPCESTCSQGVRETRVQLKPALSASA
jgi:GNAT superfamily N-acetyltransferase